MMYQKPDLRMKERDYRRESKKRRSARKEAKLQRAVEERILEDRVFRQGVLFTNKPFIINHAQKRPLLGTVCSSSEYSYPDQICEVPASRKVPAGLRVIDFNGRVWENIRLCPMHYDRLSLNPVPGGAGRGS